MLLGITSFVYKEKKEIELDEIKLGENKILDFRCWNCGYIANINTCKNIEKRIGFPNGASYGNTMGGRTIILRLWHYTGRCPVCGAWIHLSTCFRVS